MKKKLFAGAAIASLLFGGLNPSVANAGSPQIASIAAPKFEWLTTSGSSHVSTIHIFGRAALDPSDTATMSRWCLLVDANILPSGRAWLTTQGMPSHGYGPTDGCFYNFDYAGSVVDGDMGVDFTGLLAASEKTSKQTHSDLTIRVYDTDGLYGDSGIFRVTAYLGQLSYSVINNTPVATPEFSPTVQVISNTVKANSATVSWNAPVSPAAPPTGYIVDTSSDGGVTWSTTKVNDTSFNLKGLAKASATLAKVATQTGDVTGPFGAIATVATLGTRTQKIHVIDANGEAVTGGAITYKMKGTSRSSKTALGLLSDGTLNFESAPAGNATVTISQATLADGVSVSGSAPVVFGAGVAQIILPEHTVASTKIYAAVGGDIYLGDININVSTPFRKREAAGYFIYSTSDPLNHKGAETFFVHGTTSYQGFISVNGFISHGGDGTVSATPVSPRWQDEIPRSSSLSAGYSLAYFDGAMPLLEVAKPVVKATNGQVASLEVRYNSQGNQGLSSGLPISVIPPAAASNKGCPTKSLRYKATTDTDGIATFKVCASKSGVYQFHYDGAFPIGAVTLHVAKAPPMPIRALKVVSNRPSSLTATWNKPEYIGTAAVSSYQVTLKPFSGGASIVQNVKSRSATFSKLKHATKYTIRVIARTAYGTSYAVSEQGGAG